MNGLHAPWRRRVGLVLVLAAAAFMVVVLFAPTVFSSALRAAGLAPEPDHFTALYFDKQNEVLAPTHESVIPVSFAIENHEGGWRRYHYEVVVGPANHAGRVTTVGTVDLGRDQRKTKTLEIATPLRGRTRVTVSLNTAQSIAFWTFVKRPSPSGRKHSARTRR